MKTNRTGADPLAAGLSIAGRDASPHVERDACAALVRLAAREAVAGPTPRQFVRRLGQAGAGVRPGLAGLVDLALAGSNPLPGHGFRHALDDGTGGQVRHFCGIACARDRFGARLTWWVSVYLRRDPPDTPDGRLTDLAIEFVDRLHDGRLDVRDAADWLRRTLCAPRTDPLLRDTGPDAPHA